jgi:hypothetical protein
MRESKSNLSTGVFDPLLVNELFRAFGKAKVLVDRSIPRGAPGVEGMELARFILAEVRSGEIQPDLVARAAVGKALLQQKRRQPKIERNYDETNSRALVNKGTPSTHGIAKWTRAAGPVEPVS